MAKTKAGNDATEKTTAEKEKEARDLIDRAGGALLLRVFDEKIEKQRKPVIEATVAIAVLTLVFGGVQWVVAEKHHKYDTDLASTQYNQRVTEEKARVESDRVTDARRYRRSQLNSILDRFLAANTEEARLRVISAIRGLPALDDDEKVQVSAMLDTLQNLITAAPRPTEPWSPSSPLTIEGRPPSPTEPADTSHQLKVQALQDLAEAQKKVDGAKSQKTFRLQIAQGYACDVLAKQASKFRIDAYHYDAHVYHVKPDRGCALTIGETDYQGAVQSWVNFTSRRITGFTNAVIVASDTYGAEYSTTN